MVLGTNSSRLVLCHLVKLAKIEKCAAMHEQDYGIRNVWCGLLGVFGGGFDGR